MKQFITCTAILCILASCNNKQSIVDVSYADSLVTNYTPPASIKTNEDELAFWKNRIDPVNTGYTNETKYALLLSGRFNLSGNILDIIAADSMQHKIDIAYGHKEAGPLMSLCKLAILQHQFREADSLLTAAKKIGIKPYESLATSFDVDFELGRMLLAQQELKQMADKNDYGYNFRLAKMAHYNADLDKAVSSMQKAADLADNDTSLQQAALSNAADLYLHNNQPEKAYALYRRSIRLNDADLHSIMGIGWIALVHDKNDSLATTIFRFVSSRTKAPDPVFKLSQTAEAAGDTVLAIQYARMFEKQVTDPVYGNMYNKYLLQLYTGLLHKPAEAELIAKRELLNRNTPQTEAWYVWALFSNNKTDEAYRVYQQYVSGKPLEGLELYWMGKLMQRLKKGYNANQFFKEALKNKYDLNPVYVADIKEGMEE